MPERTIAHYLTEEEMAYNFGMRIFFERTGGFAGQKLQASIDADALPPPEAKQLRTLLRKSRWCDLPPERNIVSAGADRFHYKLTIESDAGVRTIEVNDAAVPIEMRPLLDWFTRIGRR
jgi:hypothetical protein